MPSPRATSKGEGVTAAAMPSRPHLSWRPYAVVNPVAGQGRTSSLWPSALASLRQYFGHLDWAWTEAPMAAIEISKQAALRGYNLIVSVGGDGTHNEVVNGLMAAVAASAPEPVALGIIPSGSGADLARTLPPARLAANAGGGWFSYIRLDVGEAEFAGADGRRQARYFINVASFGLSARVTRLVASQPRLFPGPLRYLLATLQALARGSNPQVAIGGGGGITYRGATNTVAVANGRFFGGGMQIAPEADPADGRLDCVVIGKVGLLDFLCWAPRFYRGQHLRHPQVWHYRVPFLNASSDSPVAVEMDGENVGWLPATFSLHPAALAVVGTIGRWRRHRFALV